MKLHKRVSAFILVICIAVSAFVLTACKDKDKKDDSKDKKGTTSVADSSETDTSIADSKASTIWGSNQFSIDGKMFTLPCKLTELEAIGFNLTADKDDSIKPKYIVTGMNLKNDKGYIISGRYYNPTDKAIPLSECSLVGFTVSTNISGNADFDIILPGNITMQSTKDDVIKAYGEPIMITDKEGSDHISIEYRNSLTDRLIIQFSRETGKITSYERKTM